MSMANFARSLSNRLGAPVQDLTRMTGIYDIDISWEPDPAFDKVRAFGDHAPDLSAAAADAASLPSGGGNIFTVIRDALGLRLEPGKKQVEVIVVDHIEHIPIEN
jgi:uncharacterized protein (TIGR03435 family)